MRSGVIGLIIGAVIGIVIGATVIAPRLHSPAPTAEAPPVPPAEVARDLPKLLLPRPAVEMKLAAAFGEETPLAGSLARRLVVRLSEASRGQIEMRFHEPGTLVASGDVLGAVASGAVDAGFIAPGITAPEKRALQIFAGVPFGPDADELLAWLDVGGGRQHLVDLGHRLGVHPVACGMLPAAAAGWFRDEIETLADLRGLRIRANGLGSTALKRLGAETREADPRVLVEAIDNQEIDAAILAAPAIDRHFELQSRLKVYYFPGWQQSPSLLLLLVHLPKWEALKSSQRVLIDTVCGDNLTFAIAESPALQIDAVRALYADGVRFERWPAPLREELRRAWTQLAEELASRDAEFRRVWTSLADFRDRYQVWRDLNVP